MTTATTRTTLDQLDEHQAAVDAAVQRVRELEDEKVEGQRNAERARAELDSYYHELGSGERTPDSRREAALRKAVEDAGAESNVEVIDNPRSETLAGGTKVHTTNARLDAMLRGAREAVDVRRHEYDQFVARHFEALVEELTVLAGAVGEQFAAVWGEVQHAQREYEAVAARWRPLITSGAFAPGDIPRSPLTGVDRMPLPVPQALLDGGEINVPRKPKVRRRSER